MAGCRLQKRRQHADGRRLPGSVGSQKAEYFPGIHLKADTIDGEDDIVAGRTVPYSAGCIRLSVGSRGR